MTTFQPGGPERYAHQKRGLKKLIETGGVGALLFDPGMGKTAVILDYASLLAIKSVSGEARVLVVCPLAAVDTWVLQARTFMSPQVSWWAEAIGGSLLERAETLASRGGNPFRKLNGKEPPASKGRWGPRALHHGNSWAWDAQGPESRMVPITRSEGPDGLGDELPRVVIEVTNIDTMMSRMAVGNKTMADVMLDAVKRFNPDLVVVDEAHKIKSARGNASRLMARIGSHVRRRAILTGTVMPLSPLDVFGQWQFLEPYAFGDRGKDGNIKAATFGGFKARYATMGGYMGWQVVGFRNLDEMQQIMAKNAVVARKSEALDLPPTTDVVVPVELSPAEKKAYSEMRDALAVMLSPNNIASVPNRLSQMMRLRQITSGHLPTDTGGIADIGISKAATIKSIIEDTLAGEKRVVVFCYFSREIDQIVSLLDHKTAEVMRIEGPTPTEERTRLRKRFGSSDPTRMVLVAQVKTLSLAVNELVTANHAIFGSLSQQRDDLIQARDRLDRIGQTQPVTFWYAMAPGTVDEVILKSHNERTDLEDAMLRHIRGAENE